MNLPASPPAYTLLGESYGPDAGIKLVIVPIWMTAVAVNEEMFKETK